ENLPINLYFKLAVKARPGQFQLLSAERALLNGWRLRDGFARADRIAEASQRGEVIFAYHVPRSIRESRVHHAYVLSSKTIVLPVRCLFPISARPIGPPGG